MSPQIHGRRCQRNFFFYRYINPIKAFSSGGWGKHTVACLRLESPMVGNKVIEVPLAVYEPVVLLYRFIVVDDSFLSIEGV